MTKLLIFRNGLPAVLVLLLGGCATSARYVNYSEYVAVYEVDAHVAGKMKARLPLET